MKYKTCDDLMAALLDRMDALPNGLTSAEAKQWYDQDPATQELKYLWWIYDEALISSPQPYVGVGRITYAEGVLQAAQKG